MESPELIPIDEPGVRAIIEERGLLTPLVDLAIRQAIRSHGSQLRDNGDPYLSQHIFPVAVDYLDYALEHRSDSPAEAESGVVVALLHDTVEDDRKFPLTLCRKKFGSEITEAVWRLSKLDEDNVPYMNKLWEGSLTVKAVKIADRINNLLSSEAMLPDRYEKLVKYLAESKTHYMPLAESIPDGVYATKLKCVIGVATVALQDLELAPIT